jgi:N-acetylneuraminic acid mutarotase
LGGSDAQRHYNDCFLMQWASGQLQLTSLPDLPRACANFCGARLGNKIYVAGGIDRPAATTALHTFWVLDLSVPKAGWRELPPWPGPGRMLATAGGQGGAFYLFGGAAAGGGGRADARARRRQLAPARARRRRRFTG